MECMIVKNVEERILEAFERIGILIDDPTLPLMDYISDSLSFISSVVELEDEFGIMFPNDLLTYEVFQSMDNLINIINEISMESK